MRIDSTALSTLGECPRKFFYRFEKDLVPRGIAVAMEFGKYCHAGGAAYYREKRSVEAALAALENCWKQVSLEDPKGVRTLDKAKEVLKAYHVQFREEKWEPLEVEINFALELTSDLVYTGIIDGLGKSSETGLVYPHEFKTSSSPWLYQARPNAQLLGYVWAAQELFGFEDGLARGMMTVAGLFKTSKEGLLKGKGGEFRSIFTREIADFQPWEIEEWKKEVLEKVGRIQDYRESEFWPKETKSCMSYGSCAYQPLCCAPEAFREEFAESNFEKRKWDPLEEVR